MIDTALSICVLLGEQDKDWKYHQDMIDEEWWDTYLQLFKQGGVSVPTEMLLFTLPEKTYKHTKFTIPF